MWSRAAASCVVVALAMAVGLLGVGPARAATELTLSPASGPPGTEFVVTGTGFAALPVEIRWGGLSGPVIATAIGPDFSVPATVPDSPPNSHPVVAVVTEGGSVSTSSASFQVTGGEAPAPVETTTTTEVTTTTVAEAPATSPTASIPGGETGRSPISSSRQRDVAAGVDGGVGGGVADTTNAGGTGAAPTGGGGATTGGGGATVPSTPTTIAAAEATTLPTVPLPAGSDFPAVTPQGAAVPVLPEDGVTSAALAPPRTNQSAGAVSNPALLLLGLALVFGGGVFLAVRNRHRA